MPGSIMTPDVGQAESNKDDEGESCMDSSVKVRRIPQPASEASRHIFGHRRPADPCRQIAGRARARAPAITPRAGTKHSRKAPRGARALVRGASREQAERPKRRKHACVVPQLHGADCPALQISAQARYRNCTASKMHCGDIARRQPQSHAGNRTAARPQRTPPTGHLERRARPPAPALVPRPRPPPPAPPPPPRRP